MPDSIQTYDMIRARVAARRAQNPQKPWWQSALDTASDVVGGVGDVVLPSKTLSDYWEGPLYALRHPIDSAKLVGGAMLDAQIDQFRQAGKAPTLSEKIGHAAAGALPLLGPMAANAGETIGKGEFARGAGQALGILGPIALGAGMRGKPVAEVLPPEPKPPIRGLLPERTGPRFFAGERGIADTQASPLTDVGPVRPNFGEKGTVLPQERNQVANVEPIVRANFSGTGEPAPMRNVPSSAGIDPFASTQNRAFEALVPDRFKRQQNLQPFEGDVVPQPKPAFYPPEDPRPVPSRLPDVDAIDARVGTPDMTTNRTVRPAPPKKQTGPMPRMKAKRNAAGDIVPSLLEGEMKEIAKPIVMGEERPYSKLRDNDLQTLADIGDKRALEELDFRKRQMGGFDPRAAEAGIGDVSDPSQARLSLGDRLTDETGAVGPGVGNLMRRARRILGLRKKLDPESQAVVDRLYQAMGDPDAVAKILDEDSATLRNIVDSTTRDLNETIGGMVDTGRGLVDRARSSLAKLKDNEQGSVPLGRPKKMYTSAEEALPDVAREKYGKPVEDLTPDEYWSAYDDAMDRATELQPVDDVIDLNAPPSRRLEAGTEAEPTVRLYRGESDSSQPGALAGQTFTDDPMAAVYYAKQGGGAGRTYYIDLPASEAAKYKTADATGQGVHILPPELAEKARGNLLGKGAEGQSIIKPKSKILSDESGKITLRPGKTVNFDKPMGGSNYFHQSVNPEFDANFAKWVNARRASKVEGLLKGREFRDLASRGMQGIHDFQAGLKSGRFADVAKYFNEKHQTLKDLGVKLGFRENYLPQLWENPADEVFAVTKKLGLKPQFTLERVLENYHEGIKAGLKPKFETIGELIGWYEQRANKAIADRQFFDSLKSKGLILTRDKAPETWVTLNPDHFPVQKFITKRGQKELIFKAPPKVAAAINNYLGEGHPAFRALGNTATVSKNVVLSSGVPGTGINAHGFNIAARNVMARGLVRGGAEAAHWLIRPGKARAWLNQNLAKAPEAVHSGLTLTTEEHAFGSTGSTNITGGAKGRLGRAFNKVLELHGKYFEDPLFQNIIPALKLKHWDSLKTDFMKQGMAREAASKAAASATNELYGGINWEAMQRSRDLQNLLRGIILAPDWFESQYRIGKGMVNTLRDPKNPRGLAYKREAMNLIAAYVAADVMNYSINGHHMWENETGHALDVKIGSVGGKTRYLRPFGTAADFARLPFDTIAGIGQGDLSAPTKILKNRLSTTVRPGLDLLMNEDPFGNPIFGPDKYGRPQSIPKQLGAAGREVTTVGLPQYVAGPLNYATGRAGSAEEAILGTVEAPVRYSRESTKRHSRYRSSHRRRRRQE